MNAQTLDNTTPTCTEALPLPHVSTDDLQEALAHLRGVFGSDNLASVKVELEQHREETPTLKWSMYHGVPGFSGGKPTPNDCIQELIQKARTELVAKADKLEQEAKRLRDTLAKLSPQDAQD